MKSVACFSLYVAYMLAYVMEMAIGGLLFLAWIPYKLLSKLNDQIINEIEKMD